MKSLNPKSGFVHILLLVAVALVIGVGAGIVISSSNSNPRVEIEPEAKNQNPLEESDVEVVSTIANETEIDIVNETENDEVTEVIYQKPAEVVKIIPVGTSETVSIAPKLPVEVEQEQKPVVATASLQILNVSATEEETEITISWETSIESDSRLVLHNGDTEKIYVSKNESSKRHSVYIDNLESSLEYSYEIIASSGGKEINKFGSARTTRVFNIDVVSLFGEDSDKDECTVLAIVDTQDKPLRGAAVTISGANQTATMRYYTDTENEVTDADGEIEYCHKATELKLVITSIGYTFKSKNSSMTTWEVTKPK